MKELTGKKVVMLLDNPFLSDVRVYKEATALIEQDVFVTVLCTIDDALPEKKNE